MNNASPSSSLFIYTFANLFCHWFFPNYIFKIHEHKDQGKNHCTILKSAYRMTYNIGTRLDSFCIGPQSPTLILLIIHDLWTTNHHHWSRIGCLSAHSHRHFFIDYSLMKKYTQITPRNKILHYP